MIKFKLDQDSLTNDFFDNFRLFGIMAPIKNYTFCWKLNVTLGTNFKLSNQKELKLHNKQRNYFFNLYEWQEPNSFLEHHLYHNQYDGNYLLPEFKNMDFLWLMKGDIVEEEKCNWLKNTVKSIEGVQLIVELSKDKIKNKSNLIF